MSTTQKPALPVTAEYWRRFLVRTVAPEDVKDMQRDNPRYPYVQDGVLEYSYDDATTRCHMKLLEVAEDGITGRTNEQVPKFASARFEFAPEGRPIVLEGTVIHCTQTVGGFKTGMRLTFSVPGEGTPEQRKVHG